MRVTFLYFAAARERAGVGSEALELPQGATAGQALAAACEKHQGLRAISAKLRVAVDENFVSPEHALPDGATVALIPPVSGGSGPHRIGPEPLALDQPQKEVEGTDCGAVVSFVGTVRSTNHGQIVVRLEYEAYDGMALRVFERIAAESKERWGARVAIHHRTGALNPGELSVVIAAAAPHRADAFEACRHAIESLKKDAPIWKREIYPDGSSWVGLGS
jgi:molybdopterin synthase catalytic subunit